MAILLREIEMANGLQLQFIDKSSHYYGGFHRVSVTIRCELPIVAEYCRDGVMFSEAVALFGDKILFIGQLERMGVPELDIRAVQDQLIDHFIETSLDYLGSSGFPSAFIAAEIGKLRKKRGSLSARYSG